MTHENAIKFFQLDSFSHRSKEKCTAGALRAESPDVDLSIKSAGGKPARAGGGHVTSQDITQQLAQAFAEPLPDA